MYELNKGNNSTPSGAPKAGIRVLLLEFSAAGVSGVIGFSPASVAPSEPSSRASAMASSVNVGVLHRVRQFQQSADGE